MTFLLPAEPGSYALQLALPAGLCLRIGRLGAFDFPAGEYLYLGSARGPGGLRGRLGHHLRPIHRPRWHIDYLRLHAGVMGGWYSLDPGKLECAWSHALGSLPSARIPATGFGAADCASGCPAHLVLFPGGLPVGQVVERLCRPGGWEVAVLPFEREGNPDSPNGSSSAPPWKIE